MDVRKWVTVGTITKWRTTQVPSWNKTGKDSRPYTCTWEGTVTSDTLTWEEGQGDDVVVTTGSQPPVSRVVETGTVVRRGRGCDGGRTLIHTFRYLDGGGTRR